MKGQMLLRTALIFILITGSAAGVDRAVPKDLSTIRGFNYAPAWATGPPDHWLHYKPEVADRDMDLALKLKLN